MNKFKVKVLHFNGDVQDVIVEGTDGPEFQGDNGMYKLLGCDLIEITGARYKDKNYDLYIDEEGRYKNPPFINVEATLHHREWLTHEGRMSLDPRVVGVAALVDMEPINE